MCKDSRRRKYLAEEAKDDRLQLILVQKDRRDQSHRNCRQNRLFFDDHRKNNGIPILCTKSMLLGEKSQRTWSRERAMTFN